MKLTHYIYKMTLSIIERNAIKYPQIKQNKLNIIDIKLKNVDLNNVNYDFKQIHIWINVFQPYEEAFLNKIQNSMFLRKSLSKKQYSFDEHILYLYKEYIHWLEYARSLNLQKPIKQLKKYFLTFFSEYNKIYYLNIRQQQTIRKYNYSLNPFIDYWFSCQEIETVLNLPQFSIFLPNILELYNLITKP